MPRIIVDQETCIGCGACVAVASELFEIDENGKAQTKKIGELNDEELKLANEGVETCPVQSIKVE